ncbi:MAG: anthranilate synthase component I family protein [Aureliella sp.]
MQSETLGRYSYMSASPVRFVRLDKPTPDPMRPIRDVLLSCPVAKIDNLPPMQGGWMGWWGYEMGRCFEAVDPAGCNDFHLPLAAFGLYDVVLSWDHATGDGWIVSQGCPGRDASARQRRAYGRLQTFLSWLEQPAASLSSTDSSGVFHAPAEAIAPQFPTRWSERWTSNFSALEYRRAVQKCVDYIHAGDIFQVNLSQRLLGRAWAQSPDLYMHLRQKSPAPFAGYADFGRGQIVSSSPERFISLNDGHMEARPIKGTRPRLSDPTADAAMAELLRESEKDRSENVMIVDLLRNDISRVAQDDSVKVTSLCGVERYAYVWHLVSVIEAKLAAGRDACDLVAASFPGGSITGAPKIRAMEIVSELEPTVRGAYCGSMGYISLAGDLDLNILIRTLTACDGWWQVPVGGGIVASSDPHLEEQETWHKAEGILRALDSLKCSDARRALYPR